MTAAPQVSMEKALAWRLVQAAPGALLYGAPPVETRPHRRRRDDGWTPAGASVEVAGDADEPVAHSALEYAGRELPQVRRSPCR